MAKVKQIKNLLQVQSLEDFYSMNIAGKTIDSKNLILIREASKDYYKKCNKFNKRKTRVFTSWVENKIKNENRKVFPPFLELYLEKLYRPNGLKNYTSKNVYEIVLVRKPEGFEDCNVLVREFEDAMVKKTWWNESDSILWKEHQQKRKNVEDFENYIYKLEEEIIIPIKSFEDESSFREHLPMIYNKHLNKIRLEIAEIKLFKVNLSRIAMLENLIDYISALAKDYEYYHYLFTKVFKKEESIAIENIPLNLEGQEKFVYCSKLGVIEYLIGKIGSSGVKYTDAKLYPLISFITGNSIGSVKKLMSFHKNNSSSTDGNPYMDAKLMKRVDKYLINNNLIKTGD